LARRGGTDAERAVGDAEAGDVDARLEAAPHDLSGADGARPRGTIGHSKRWLWPLAVAAALVLGAAIDRLVLQRDSVIDTPRTIANVDSMRSDSSTVSRKNIQERQVVTDPKPRPRPGLERSAAPEQVATNIERGAPRGEQRAPSAVTADPSRVGPARSADAGANATLRLAATQTLVQAEMLLAAYRADDSTEARQLGRWARDVLVSTRLLLDSKVANDVKLRTLLQDLELVLMQVAQLSGAALDDIERDLLDRTLKDRDLLPRIRSAVPTGAAIITTTSTSD
jgi:hypothetical protein